MSTRFPELGRAAVLLKAQDADLAIAHELMRGRTSLEQIFVAGLQALVDKHKPQPEEENREYTRVLITALEQEIGARSVPKPEVPEHPSIDEEALTERIPMIQHLREMHKAHEYTYAALLASNYELQRWKDKMSDSLVDSRMPLVELKYRWSVHHQRQSAEALRAWYQTKLSPLVESHHSALEETKTTMIRTIHVNIDCASTCSRIYSRALESAEGLLPLSHRASIEERLEAEMNSHTLRPVDYCNWFYDGQPSPLLFGIGTIIIDPDIVSEWGYHWLDREGRLGALQAERENDLPKVGRRATWFELSQYAPLLPLNSSEVERLKSAKTISRRDLPTLLSLDEPIWEPLGSTRRKKLPRRDLTALISPYGPVWEPLGSTRRKELLKMVIARTNSDWSTSSNSDIPRWLTFCDDAYDIVNVIRRKWDFDNDRPKPRE